MANMGKDGMDYAIGIFLTILVGAAILPGALDDWFADNVTQGWGSGVASLWPIVPLMAIIGLVYYFYRRAK